MKAGDLGPEDLPVPFGIEAESGQLLPGLTTADLARIAPDAREVSQRSVRGWAEHFAISDIDPNNLTEAGWCVLYALQVDPRVQEALAPLVNLRRQQAGRLFKEFSGASGVRPGDDARKWIERQGAGLGVVDPERGVPLYVLLVGSPAEISFEFQYLLDLYWNVGRVHFDTPEEYRRYAESVVLYEGLPVVPTKKRAAIFAVQNDGDYPTALLMRQVAQPLAVGTPTVKTLQGFQGFQVTAILGKAATKARLGSLLGGIEKGDTPALLFTGSHGVSFKMTDPAQREKQGAILCQDWPGSGPVLPEHLFTADDLLAGNSLQGLIHFFFACYGGGCPQTDNFGLAEGEPSRQLVPEAIVARLPQRMLTNGALASFAHVDRAWAYSFQNGRGAPLVQDFRDVMVRILRGQRLGQALDGFNMRWAVLSADLQENQNPATPLATDVAARAELANRYVARNDARNYIVIGDPAVRLRVEAMAS